MPTTFPFSALALVALGGPATLGLAYAVCSVAGSAVALWAGAVPTRSPA